MSVIRIRHTNGRGDLDAAAAACLRRLAGAPSAGFYLHRMTPEDNIKHLWCHEESSDAGVSHSPESREVSA